MKTLELTVEIWQEGNMYTAYCHELDVASAGKTPEEARKNIREALGIFFEETARKGTLLELLKEAGFDVAKAKRATRLVSQSRLKSIENIRLPVGQL